tara:strand:- start:262 stop:1386 length:1125 start_codon:yes stop_codon:yes gene_type:complete
MNQQINEDKNTIDTGVSDFTSFDLLEQPSEFKTQIDETYKVEDDLAENSNFLKDLGKGAVQLIGAETLGLVNRALPTTGLGTADEDYYGGIDAFNSMFSNALGYGPDQEGQSLTIPYDQYTSNPRFTNHMKELNMVAHVQAGKKIHPDLGMAIQIAQAGDGDPSHVNQILDSLYKQAEDTQDEDLLLQLDNFTNNSWRVSSFDESGENIIINQLPEIDEGLFGFDMTLDPSFSSKGDLILPGEGVFGMRDGKLTQLASSVSRPLDEMFMEGTTPELAQWMSDNVTDKIAFQGPEMLPPEGVGIGYHVPMIFGLAKGAGWPALKTAFKGGKGAYNLSKNALSNRNYELPRYEPYIESNMDQGLGSIQQGDLFNNQ